MADYYSANPKTAHVKVKGNGMNIDLMLKIRLGSYALVSRVGPDPCRGSEPLTHKVKIVGTGYDLESGHKTLGTALPKTLHR